MRNIFLVYLGLLFVFSATALASDNYARVRFLPGDVESGHVSEMRIDGTIGNDPTIEKVYRKMKEIPKSGLNDYVLPDASSIELEVNYNGETLKSSITTDVGDASDPKKYDAFSKAWFEAYSVVEEALKEAMDFPIGSHT